jgi:4a-hydroxytetrahydrobiopterin dehydratase
MTKALLLSQEDLQQALTDPLLRAWAVRDGKLYRDYRFPSFVEAFGFMASAALRAEAMNHHPEWTNIYNQVTVLLSTHDSGGITEKDLSLARHLERLATGRTLA